jgi:formate/nitrite transporter
MSYLQPADFVTKLVDQGESKVYMSERDMVLRGFMAGATLALAVIFAVSIAVNTGSFLVGALLFPVGFAMLYLMGYDLLTGVFTIVPMAWLDRRPGVTFPRVLKCWALVGFGNLAGSLFIAGFGLLYFTQGLGTEVNDIGQQMMAVGEKRTSMYEAAGFFGMLHLFMRAMFCNWMVSMGVVGASISTTVSGKVIGMWMPIMIFFYLGFEHSVVNMFLFPVGLMMGANFTFGDYIFWNEIPTVLGNLAGGLTLVGLVLYTTHVRTGPKKEFPITGKASHGSENGNGKKSGALTEDRPLRPKSLAGADNHGEGAEM